MPNGYNWAESGLSTSVGGLMNSCRLSRTERGAVAANFAATDSR